MFVWVITSITAAKQIIDQKAFNLYTIEKIMKAYINLFLTSVAITFSGFILYNLLGLMLVGGASPIVFWTGLTIWFIFYLVITYRMTTFAVTHENASLPIALLVILMLPLVLLGFYFAVYNAKTR